jgi:hypothetical protein
MTAEGTGAAVAVAATLAMAPADSSGGNGGGRKERRRQTETEAAAGADNNQPESSSNSSENGDRVAGGIDDQWEWRHVLFIFVRCERRRKRSSEFHVCNFALHVYTFYLFVYTSTCYTGAYFWVKICTRVACKHVNM